SAFFAAELDRPAR
ncbi:transposase, partial [Mycobacterium tuberculosis UT0058]